MNLPDEFTVRHGLVFGSKGNRIYEVDDHLSETFDVLSPALREVVDMDLPGATQVVLASLPPSRRNLNHMPESTWLHDTGIPPCVGCNCD